MGFFDRFKSKPKPCQLCHREFKKLNKYNSVYFKLKQANDPKMMCTDCLLATFKRDLSNFKGRIVFHEPWVEEGYVFTRFVDEPSKKLIAEPLMTFLAPERTNCAKCFNPARFTWATWDIVDDDKDVWAYKSKEESSGYKYLCDDHLLEEFAAWTKQQNFFYMEFWPPRKDGDGYFY